MELRHVCSREPWPSSDKFATWRRAVGRGGQHRDYGEPLATVEAPRPQDTSSGTPHLGRRIWDAFDLGAPSIHTYAHVLHPLRPRPDVVRELLAQLLRSAAHVLRAHLGEPLLNIRALEHL